MFRNGWAGPPLQNMMASPLTKNVWGTAGMGYTDSIIAGETCFILLRISSTIITAWFHS